MGAVAGVVAGASAVTGLIGGSAQANKQSAAIAAQQEAAEIQNLQNRLAADRERIQLSRQVRGAQADLIAAGEALGGSGSSAVQGSLAGLQSQQAANLAFSFEQERLEEERIRQLGRSASLTQEANRIGNITQGIGGVFGSAQNVFGSPFSFNTNV